MNIVIYFSRQINPQSGGTERVAFLLYSYLKEIGQNVVQMACIQQSFTDNCNLDTVYLPDEIEDATPNNVKFLQSYVRDNKIDVIINESGNSDAIFLFSHEYIDQTVKIITHLHFDIFGDITAFYRSLNLPIFNCSVRTKCKNLLKWIKAPYNKHRAIEWKRRRYSYMVDFSDIVVVLTQQHVHDLNEFLSLKLSCKIVAIKNPFSFNLPIYNENKTNTIIYVGRLDYPKRVDRILFVWNEIRNKYPDWQLKIIGSGSDEMRLKFIVDKYHINRVQFVGQTAPAKYYAEAKILLMTSNYEGTPMVITECMAYGVIPIVMNTFPGVYDLIDDNTNGIISPKYDIHKMAKLTESIIKNEEKRSCLSINAYKKIKDQNNQQLLNKWKTILK